MFVWALLTIPNFPSPNYDALSPPPQVADLEAAKPYLMMLGNHVTHCGPVGAGSVAKLVGGSVGGGAGRGAGLGSEGRMKQSREKAAALSIGFRLVQ